MRSDTGDRARGDDSHVRERVRVVRRGDERRMPIDALRRALDEAEQRFLLTRGAGAASIEALVSCMEILTELNAVDQRLIEFSERRDIPYVVDQGLASLTSYCGWLTRRVTDEFLLGLQVLFERELKRVIDPQAYELLLRLEEIADVTREVEALSGRELTARLTGGLLRGLLEQAREVCPSVHPTDTPGSRLAMRAGNH